ncbi:MAG: helix-turn-helix transcriptional regulator [Pseudomonadota bacterium]
MSEDKIQNDAFDWAYDRYVKGDDNLVELFDELDAKLEIARELYELRISKGLTRHDVAELVGVTPSIIEDIEEADYQGDFLAMATRVAAALRRRLEIRLVELDQTDIPGCAAL